MSGVLYEEIFDIKDVDPEGKQFERVQRIHAECESSKMELILDVNSLLYVPHTGEKVCPTQINLFLNRGASFRWSFGPLSAWGSIESTTTLTTHPSLISCSK